MFAARKKEKTRVTIIMRRCDLDRYNVGAPRSMPASARGPAKSSLPLQTRITPPSTPVLPLSPRKAARVQHLPQPLVPRLLCADQLRIATAALVNAHQPRSATAILANVPAPPAPTTLLEHLQTSAVAPAHPYPRPGSHRVLRAEVACAELEQTMQAHYKHVKPPMMPGANSASAGTPRRSCTAGDGKRNEETPQSIPRAFTGARPAWQANRVPPPGLPADKPPAEAEPPRARPPFVTVSHDEVWGHVKRPPGEAWRIWRRLRGPAARRPGSVRVIVFEGGIWTGL